MLGSFELLYLAVPLAGVSYGAFNALCPTLISEIFGNDYFGAIYATNSISNGDYICPFRSFGISVRYGMYKFEDPSI